MRYEGWEVTLYPLELGCQGPIQEFRVECHIVPDDEYSDPTAPSGMPSVSCFIPSLEPGSLFKVAINNWKAPEIGPKCGHPMPLAIEARVLIEDELVATCRFEANTRWPQDIFHGTESNEPAGFLSFPQWNNEDTGRIKIVLSECAAQDSSATSVRKAMGSVCFDFAHAPLGTLQDWGIAWPNRYMWGCTAAQSSMPAAIFDPEMATQPHAYSPHPRSQALQPIGLGQAVLKNGGPAQPVPDNRRPTVGSIARNGALPFGPNVGNFLGQQPFFNLLPNTYPTVNPMIGGALGRGLESEFFMPNYLDCFLPPSGDNMPWEYNDGFRGWDGMDEEFPAYHVRALEILGSANASGLDANAAKNQQTTTTATIDELDS